MCNLRFDKKNIFLEEENDEVHGLFANKDKISNSLFNIFLIIFMKFNRIKQVMF